MELEKAFEAFASHLKKEIEDSVEDKFEKCLPKAIKKASRPATMNAEEVMNELNISSYSTLKKLRDTGKLSYIKDGRRVIYPTESIDNYIKDHLIEGEY